MTQGTATLRTRSVDPGAPTDDAFSTLLAYCEANGDAAVPSLSRLIDIEFEIEEFSHSGLMQPARLGPCGLDEGPTSPEDVLVGTPHTS